MIFLVIGVAVYLIYLKNFERKKGFGENMSS